MAFREVTMVEIKEVLRQWLAGAAKKRIAARLSLDPKTVRRYTRAGEGCGLTAGAGVETLTDAVLGQVVGVLCGAPPREHGEAWRLCHEQRDFVRAKLEDRVKLTKIRKLLWRNGVEVPYSTLHRYAAAELGFGRPSVTMPVADGAPGEELQVDTGWMILMQPDAAGRRRRFRAWIFTPCVSRYRFVWPCFQESTATAIEACERAWEFYGGVFRVLVPDNPKGIVVKADPLEPKITVGFLEYAQARGFVVDPARVRRAKDKARVERAVQDVRNDCFGGERILDLDHARDHALRWCRDEYGMRRHTTTRRLPRELFDAVEKTVLLPPPVEPYDVPLWADPKVPCDHLAHVASALYSLPTHYIGKKLRARADSQTVRFYLDRLLVKTHPRQPPGGRSIDPSDFPAERSAYALRDVAWLQRQAAGCGESVGLFAGRLLDAPLPWTRMRAVRALLGLARRFGNDRLEQACARALTADMTNVRRLARMLELASPGAAPRPLAPVIPIARYLRPAGQYALRRRHDNDTNQENGENA